VERDKQKPASNPSTYTTGFKLYSFYAEGLEWGLGFSGTSIIASGSFYSTTMGRDAS